MRGRRKRTSHHRGTATREERGENERKETRRKNGKGQMEVSQRPFERSTLNCWVNFISEQAININCAHQWTPFGKRNTDAKIAADQSADRRRVNKKAGHVEEGMGRAAIGKQLRGRDEERNERRGIQRGDENNRTNGSNRANERVPHRPTND